MNEKFIKENMVNFSTENYTLYHESNTLNPKIKRTISSVYKTVIKPVAVDEKIGFETNILLSSIDGDNSNIKFELKKTLDKAFEIKAVETLENGSPIGNVENLLLELN